MGLTLHHVGILTPDIAEAAGQYAAKFGYRVCSEVIHDPVQTAYVQFLTLTESGALCGVGDARRPEEQAQQCAQERGRLEPFVLRQHGH